MSEWSDQITQPHPALDFSSGDELPDQAAVSSSPHTSDTPQPVSHLDTPLPLPPSYTTESSNDSTEDEGTLPTRCGARRESSESPWGLSELDVSLTGGKFNLFSDLSEEHLSQLESAVLSTEEGQQILQQTATTPERTTARPAAAATMEDEDGEAFLLDDSLITEGLRGSHLVMDFAQSFTDHAYCMNSERTSEEGKEDEVSGGAHDESAKTEDDEDDEGSQVSGGRSPRGKAPPSRRSTRIQEHEQRTQAEKIRQENIQKEQEAIASMKADTRKEYNMRTVRPQRDDGRIDYTKKKPQPKLNDSQSDLEEIGDEDPDQTSTGESRDGLSDEETEVVRGLAIRSRGRGPRTRGRGGRGLATYGTRRLKKSLDNKTDSESETFIQKKGKTKSDVSPEPSTKRLDASAIPNSDIPSSDNEDNLPLNALQSKQSTSFAGKNEINERQPILHILASKAHVHLQQDQDVTEGSEGELSQTGSMDTEEKSDGDAPRKSNRIQERIKQGKPPLKVSELFKVKAFRSGHDSSESEDSLDSTFDSDDDPEKLWCVCQQPFNKRFMICCDQCSEWYHGSCMGISKAQGKMMARNNEAWMCTVCKKQDNMETNDSHGNSPWISQPDKSCPSSSSPDSDDELPLANLITNKQKIGKPNKDNQGSSQEQRDGDVDEVAAEAGDEAHDSSQEDYGSISAESISGKAESIEEEVQAIKDKIKEVKEKRVMRDIEVEGETIRDDDKIEPPSSTKSEKSATENDKNQKKKIKDGDKSSKDKEKASKEKEKDGVPRSKERCRGPDCRHRARLNSVFCSGDCIAKHAKESLGLLEKERKKAFGSKESEPVGGDAASERIVVLERKSGKVLTGPAAPTRKTLLLWLEKHPTFEVLQPGQSTKSKSFYKKDNRKEADLKALRDHHAKKEKARREASVKERMEREREKAEREKMEREMEQKQKELIKKKKVEVAAKSAAAAASGSGPDPIRINVRKSLREMLLNRASNADDVMVSAMEIKSIALSVEEELFVFYGGVNSKYRHKFRALATQLKDNRNKGFFRKVLNAEIKPRRLVRMTSEQIGSQELSIWREEGLHKNVFELMEIKSPEKKPQVTAPKPQSVSIMKKTIKEESKPTVAPFDPSTDFLSSIIIDNTAHHGKHFFDVNCKICTGKVPMPTEPVKTEKPKPPTYEVKREPSVHVEEPARLNDTFEEALPKPTYSTSEPVPMKTVDSVSPVKSVTTALVPSMDHKPVIDIKLPMVVKPPPEVVKEQKPDGDKPVPRPLPPVAPPPLPTKPEVPLMPGVVWKGSIHAHDVAKFVACSYQVSGFTETLKKDLPGTISISGRLSPDVVFDYLGKLKASHSLTRELSLVRFEPSSDEDHSGYMLLYAFLSGRNRCGVVSRFGPGHPVKDVYIVPLSAQAKIPSVLLPFNGPGLPMDRSPLLLGVFMMSKPSKISLRDPRQKPVPEAPIPQHVNQEKTDANGSPAKTWMYTERKEFHENEDDQQQPLGEDADEEEDEEEEEVVEDDDLEDCSEATRKDPIISKFSRPDPSHTKQTIVKPVESMPLKSTDDDAEYEPDNVPYDPLMPATDHMDTDTESPIMDSPVGVVTPNQNQSQTISSVNQAEHSPLTSSAPTSNQVTNLLDQLAKNPSSPTQMTAAMFATLAATSSSRPLEEQRNLLAQLTAKVEEQKRLVEKQKVEAQQRAEQLAKRKPGPQEAPATKESSMNKPTSLLPASQGINKDQASKVLKVQESKSPIRSGPIPDLVPKLIPLERSLGSIEGTHIDLCQSKSGTAPSVAKDHLSSKKAEPTAPSVDPAGLTALPPALQQLLSGKNLENLKSIVASVSKPNPDQPDLDSALNKGDASKQDGPIEMPVPLPGTSGVNPHGDVDYRNAKEYNPMQGPFALDEAPATVIPGLGGNFCNNVNKSDVKDNSKKLPNDLPLLPPPKPVFLLGNHAQKTSSQAEAVNVNVTLKQDNQAETSIRRAEDTSTEQSGPRSRPLAYQRDMPLASARLRHPGSSRLQGARERRSRSKSRDSAKRTRRSPVWEGRGSRRRRSRSSSPRRPYDRSRRRSPIRSRHRSRDHGTSKRSRSRDRGSRQRSRDRSSDKGSSRERVRSGKREPEKNETKNDTSSKPNEAAIEGSKNTTAKGTTGSHEPDKRTASASKKDVKVDLKTHEVIVIDDPTTNASSTHMEQRKRKFPEEDANIHEKVPKQDKQGTVCVPIPYPIPPPAPPVPPQLFASGKPIVPISFQGTHPTSTQMPQQSQDGKLVSDARSSGHVKSTSTLRKNIKDSDITSSNRPPSDQDSASASRPKIPLLPTPGLSKAEDFTLKHRVPTGQQPPAQDLDMRLGSPGLGIPSDTCSDVRQGPPGKDQLAPRDYDMRQGPQDKGLPPNTGHDAPTAKTSLPPQDRDMRQGPPHLGSRRGPTGNGNMPGSARDVSSFPRGKGSSEDAAPDADRDYKRGPPINEHSNPEDADMWRMHPEEGHHPDLIHGPRGHIPPPGHPSMDHPWPDVPFGPGFGPRNIRMPPRNMGPGPPRFGPPMRPPMPFNRGRGGPFRGFPPQRAPWSRPPHHFPGDHVTNASGDVDHRFPPGPPEHDIMHGEEWKYEPKYHEPEEAYEKPVSKSSSSGEKSPPPKRQSKSNTGAKSVEGWDWGRDDRSDSDSKREEEVSRGPPGGYPDRAHRSYRDTPYRGGPRRGGPRGGPPNKHRPIRGRGS